VLAINDKKSLVYSTLKITPLDHLCHL